MAHDDFEIAIEQRLHGALEGSATEALDRHLAACELCRDYESRAQAEEKGLKTMFMQLTNAMDWNSVEARTKQALARAQRTRYLWPTVAIAFLAVQALIKQWTHPVSLAGRFSVFALFALPVAVVLWMLGRDHGRAQEANLAHSGALAFYRETLDRSIRQAEQSRWLLPLIAVAIAVLCSVLPRDPETTVLATVAAPLALGRALWIHFVRLPRLRRERGELG
jgi:hypothetical protein